jgi:hypothetical protein
MTSKSRAGKAVWTTRASTYQQDLTDAIAEDSQARLNAWIARGRIPIRVRLMTRMAGRPLRT